MSLHLLTQAMRLYLKAKECPLPVKYGPPRATEFSLRPRIVFERDRERGDSFDGAKARGLNPVQQIQRTGCLCTIVCKSDKPHAKIFDHEAECDQAARLVVLGLRECLHSEPGDDPWLGIVGPTTFSISAAGLLGADKLGAIQQLQERAAAVYQIRFTFDIGITEQNWVGEGLPEGNLGRLETVLQTLRQIAPGQPGVSDMPDLPGTTDDPSVPGVFGSLPRAIARIIHG